MKPTLLLGIQVITRAVKLEAPEISFSSLDNTEVTNSYGVVTTGKYNIASGAKDALSIASGSDKGFLSTFAYEISKHRNYQRELDGIASKVAF